MPTVEYHYQFFGVPWAEADLDGNGYIDCTGVSGVNELREAARTLATRTPLEERIQYDDYSWMLNVGENVKDMYTDQISFNIERELVKNFSLSATYIYKHAARLIANVPIDVTTGEPWAYERIAFDPDYGDPVDLYSIVWQDYDGSGGAPDGNDIVWVGQHNDFRVENVGEYSYTVGGPANKAQRTYQALQLVLNKRYSERWQGLASVVYSWSNGMAQRSIRQDDNMMGPMVTDDNFMGSVNQLVNNMTGPLPFVPKWEVKASGSYTVPVLEMDLGLRFRFHTGRPLWRLETYPVHTQWGNPPGGIIQAGGGSVVSSVDPTWMPNLAIFDFRAEKAFPIKSFGSVHIVLDVFNIFNNANVTNADYSGLWGRITGLSDARRFRVSFMYQF
jgi:hypothetical protein